MACYRKGGCGPYEGRSCSECPASKETYLNKSKVQQAIENIQNIPQVKPVNPYPIIPLIADKDGMWYLYTIWYMEQAAKTMGV